MNEADGQTDTTWC